MIPATHPRRRAAAAAIAILLPLLLASCSSGGGWTREPVLGPNSAATTQLSAAAAYPHPKVRTITHARADGAFLRTAFTGPDADSWIIVEHAKDSIAAPESENALVEDHLTRAPDGAVVLTKSVNRRERVITWFDPPLVLMPPALAADKPHTQELTLNIFPLNDPDRQRDRGAARHTITLDADQTIDLGAGPLRAQRVRAVLTIKLSAAEVTATSDLWFLADPTDRKPADLDLASPLLLERSEESVRFLALPVRATKEEWRVQRAN